MHPDQLPDQQPDYGMPNYDGAPTMEPKKLSRRNRLIAISAAGLIILGGVAAGGYALGRSAASSPTKAVAASAAPSTTANYVTATTTPAAYVRPLTNADFSVDITVLSKKCFGSAGCNVKYSINPTFNGSSSELRGRHFRVVYEILGGDEPQIGNFKLNGTSASMTETEMIQASDDAELTAKVTNVVED